MRAKHLTQRSLFFVLALTVALGAAAGDAAAAKKPWENFKFPELGDIRIPDYERHELANGMTVFLLEDHTWPLVEGEAIIRTGAAFEPANLVGLASVTGDVLRTGGTTNMPADQLDETGTTTPDLVVEHLLQHAPGPQPPFVGQVHRHDGGSRCPATAAGGVGRGQFDTETPERMLA